MPSKFLCWSPKLQCDGLWRYSLWEVTRFRGGMDSPAPMMKLMHLQEKEDGSLYLHQVRKQQAGRWPSASREVTLTRHPVCKYLNLSLLSSRTMRNTFFFFLFFKPLSLWYPVGAQRQPLVPRTSQVGAVGTVSLGWNIPYSVLTIMSVIPLSNILILKLFPTGYLSNIRLGKF